MIQRCAGPWARVAGRGRRSTTTRGSTRRGSWRCFGKSRRAHRGDRRVAAGVDGRPECHVESRVLEQAHRFSRISREGMELADDPSRFAKRVARAREHLELTALNVELEQVTGL